MEVWLGATGQMPELIVEKLVQLGLIDNSESRAAEDPWPGVRENG